MTACTSFRLSVAECARRPMQGWSRPQNFNNVLTPIHYRRLGIVQLVPLPTIRRGAQHCPHIPLCFRVSRFGDPTQLSALSPYILHLVSYGCSRQYSDMVGTQGRKQTLTRGHRRRAVSPPSAYGGLNVCTDERCIVKAI